MELPAAWDNSRFERSTLTNKREYCFDIVWQRRQERESLTATYVPLTFPESSELAYCSLRFVISVESLVDLSGIEPLTSSLRKR